MKEKQVIYYKDELNDEFSRAKIIPRKIDENYKYLHQNPLWNFCSFALQNVISVPIKVGYSKLKFYLKYVGKEKLKPYKKQGYFIYGNHTQAFGDTFIPSMMMYPKRNFLIVNPENVSMKGLKQFVEMLGAIPIPGNKEAMKHFMEAIKTRINQGYSITIYPEAHIWPYYTKIRPFKAVSFEYPVKLKTPVFCFTNTYQKYGRNQEKVQIISYIDGPFFPDENVSSKEAKQKLRDEIYHTMLERSKNSNVEVIKYVLEKEQKEESLVL